MTNKPRGMWTDAGGHKPRAAPPQPAPPQPAPPQPEDGDGSGSENDD
ncbi:MULTISPECIES: hypothetical protein [unclassified Streptomyces]|nr:MULTISPECIES: hypothetical protein [unclassified Streptomyces]WSS46818.1 hypothetical protein OG220_40350 [Streptomyces sp. NBC_01187]WSA97665.1 hypothetical protein OIE63_39870 [Streptomyces sp. NBC_01795]WSB82085.1 hypothetical protein OHB04_40945 [Streptomyces sp. NBC_01775]WSS18056.1 hypothetical protein OG533_40020 [Streptomyces sp. NBC_01186]WSS46965.1 hypothetical protein OG220_41275 [Streptomyces sp. NBC_01187]